MTDDEDGGLLREARRIAKRHAPAYVVVGRHFEVRHFSEEAGPYIEPAAGTASLDVWSLVHRTLAPPLREALAQASATGARAVRGGLALDAPDGSGGTVDLMVEPIPPGARPPAGFVVLLRDGAAPAADGRAEELERELRRTRERLQAAVAKLEVSNEELTAANEELAAANEELTVSNGDLEASRQELRAANGDLRNLLESTQIATVLLDRGLRVRAFTAAATGVFHLAPADVGRPLSDIAPRVAYPEAEADIARVLRTPAPVEREIGPPQGPRFHVRVLPYRDLEGGAAGAVLTFLDVTEAARAQAELAAAEASLRQSQKMEAVGQLTGGIAHDFNNMLQAIAGSLDMVRRRMEQGRAADAERFVDATLDTVDRAASLTHRLLAFARRQTLAPKPVEPGALIEGMADLIRRTVGPGIAVELRRMGGPAWTVLCDPNQLENALLNLAINARDAMAQPSPGGSAGAGPDGGRLVLGTEDVCLSEADVAGQDGAVPGDHVEISVADTGAGMDEATRARAFEPFFTTKPVGQGTGLGLSQLYGFVRQSGGFVRLDSAPGRGTTVRIFLPRHEPAERRDSRQPPEKARAPAAGAGEVVLLVEDEEKVRTIAAEHLRELGYRVLEAADGAAAPRLLRSGGGRVDLLVTDVGLPGGMNGRQVADAARERHPGLPVLFITGYAGGALGSQLAPGMEVMGKPFTLDALAAKVGGMIRGGRPGPGAEKEPQHAAG